MMKLLRIITKAVKDPKKAFRKAGRILFKRPVAGYCSVCGEQGILYKYGHPRISYFCKYCGAVARNRHMAIILCRVLDLGEPFSLRQLTATRPDLKVYQAQARGPIHDALASLPGYVCSEFRPDTPPGAISASGARHEDLQQLSFPADHFDVVITEDVMEHIRDTDAAWREILRVLKPGGYHVFTIPYDPARKTERRIRIEGGEDIAVLPKVYHDDGMRDSLVYTDFGSDLLEHLNQLGLISQLHGIEGL
ncbi:MAG: methyltransferase domain-containing protein, partial [Fidelibacterota bacterium]